MAYREWPGQILGWKNRVSIILAHAASHNSHIITSVNQMFAQLRMDLLIYTMSKHGYCTGTNELLQF